MSRRDELDRRRDLLSPESRLVLRDRLRGRQLGGPSSHAPSPTGVSRIAMTAWRQAGNLEVPWEVVVEAGARRAKETLPDLASASFAMLSPALDDLAVAGISRAFKRLGAFDRAGETRSADDLVRGLGIRAGYRKLIDLWLSVLAASGLLEQTPSGYRSTAPLPDPPFQEAAARAAALARGTEYEPIVGAVCAVGEMLDEIVTGGVHAAEIFLAGSASSPIERAYVDAREARYCTGILAGVMEAVVRELPGDRPLRILEVGAGIGAATRTLLPALPHGRTSYLFTDISRYFLDEARQRFAGSAHLLYGILDIDEDPLERGYVAGAFDVVVASNVVHCARFVARTLERLRSLLRRGGLALIMEATRNERWHAISMGLLEGYMSFEDQRLARRQPLLSADAWDEALRAAGFARVARLPADRGEGDLVGQHVFLGQA